MGALTFSRPKNLSLPSSRMGPACCSIFSNGVNSGVGSSFSFFLLGDASFVPSFAEACEGTTVVSFDHMGA
jgi:hypothetical protein